MNDIWVRVVITGLCFGAWPLIMNKSGLTGNTSSLILTLVVLVVVGSVAIGDIGKISGANWWAVIIASVLSAIGLLALNGGLAVVTPQQVGVFLILMTLIQISTAALYHVFQNGVTIDKLVGFGFAFAAVYFLSK